ERPPPTGLAQKSTTVSIARTTLLVMGRRGSHVASPVRRYLSQAYAISESSRRGTPSPVKVSGSLGTCWTYTATAPVAAAMRATTGLGSAGAGVVDRPPDTESSAGRWRTERGPTLGT